MEKLDLYLKNLIGKDEEKALEAASYLINNADVELYKMLVDKTEFLFDFVKNNVLKRIEKVINKDNYLNIIKFFDVYSSYYDDLFASILAKHANQDLTDDIFELLEKGTTSQKTYAAKYFSYIPDTVSIEILDKLAFSNDEMLNYNSAEALGQMQDDVSYDIAISLLSSEDDFEKLKAVKFFTAYRKNYPLDEIIKAMETSKMPENIAGQIPYSVSLLSILKTDKSDKVLSILDNILSGLGEILSLEDIFQFELYEIIEYLLKINNNENSASWKISEILLKALAKFKLFCENPEYVYDETKETKYEVSSILKLLQSAGNEFWNIQKRIVLKGLQSASKDISSVLALITEFNLKDAVGNIKELLNSEDEIVVCEAVTTLKSLNALDNVDLDALADKISNINIKAIINNLKV